MGGKADDGILVSSMDRRIDLLSILRPLLLLYAPNPQHQNSLNVVCGPQPQVAGNSGAALVS